MKNVNKIAGFLRKASEWEHFEFDDISFGSKVRDFFYNKTKIQPAKVIKKQVPHTGTVYYFKDETGENLGMFSVFRKNKDTKVGILDIRKNLL